MQAAFTEAAPAIDGSLDDPVWTRAARAQGFVSLDGGAPPTEQTEALLLYDRECLYVAFICHIADVAAKRKVLAKQGDTVWGGDCVELFVDPGRSFQYVHIAAGPSGALFFPGKSHSIRSAGTVLEKQWQVELAIPFRDIALPDPACMQAEWGVNFCRGNYTLGEVNEWSWTRGMTFHDPARFGILRGLKLDVKRLYAAQQAARPASFSGRLFVNPEKTFFSGGPRITITLHISAEESLRGRSLLLQLRDEKGTLRKEQTPHPLLLVNRVRVDVSDLPDGKYTATGRLLEGGAVLAEAEGRFWKIAPATVPDPPVEIRNGVLYRDGRPFFPIALQWGGIGFYDLKGNSPHLPKLTEEADQKRVVHERMAEIAAHGFNTIKNNERVLGEDLLAVEGIEALYDQYSGWSPRDRLGVMRACKINLHEHLAMAAEHDLSVIPWAPVITRSPELTEAQIDAWARFVLKYRNESNILAWYSEDETDEWVTRNERIYRLFKEIDPFRPVFLVVINAVAQNRNAADIHCTDPYPIGTGPVTAVAVHGDRLRKITGRNPGQLFFLWLQMYGARREKRVCPTPRQLRCMVFLALNHGAKGIGYHCYNPKEIRGRLGVWGVTEEIWQAVKIFNRQITDLSLPYLAGEPVNVASDDPRLDVAARRHAGSLYVVAVNTEPVPVPVAAVDLGPGAWPKQAPVLYEERTVTIRDHRIEDGFNGHDVRVYKIPLEGDR